MKNFLLFILLVSTPLAATLAHPADAGKLAAEAMRGESSRREPDKGYLCGYDPQGAQQAWHNHKLNTLRLRGRAISPASSGIGDGSIKTGARVEDVGDIAVIEDDGAIVMPPSKFDLKNRSILFTPDGDGYRIERGDTKFETDFGFKISIFFGAGGSLGNSDDGYRDVSLLGARFPFFGNFYSTIFIGTNGYVTFAQGDTGARPSPAALASEMPRIAALWADLDVSNRGTIYYNRLNGRHVITWDAVPQEGTGLLNTFQIALYDDGRIAFAYKKVKAQSSLVGLSPGRADEEAQPVNFSNPPSEPVVGPLFESFSKKKRLDLPALTRAFYGAHADEFDTLYIWTDFSFDNGLGFAHSFNVRNDIAGIGINFFDRGSMFGSPSRLSSVIAMGDIANDWPADPDAHVVGLNSAISIVCHEQGHRWLAYVRFDADHDIKDDLLGRDASHWSFLMDTRTSPDGNFSSCMEGNAWRENSNGTFTTIQSAVNFFTDLDQYLMGLRAAEEVGEINYLSVDEQLKKLLREGSPTSGFSLSASRKKTSVAQIIEREGPRVPEAADAQKQFRIGFILLTERGRTPSKTVLATLDRYRQSLARYFSVATGRRGSLDSSLAVDRPAGLAGRDR